MLVHWKSRWSGLVLGFLVAMGSANAESFLWQCAHGHFHQGDAGENWTYEGLFHFGQVQSAQAPPNSPDYRKFAPDRRVDIHHLKLDVTPDFVEKSVAGTATIQFKPIAYPLKELRLDAVDLRIHRVEASNPVASWHNTDSSLHIFFVEPIPVATDASVVVHYEATPAKGLYFRTADMGYRAEDVHLFTQGETTEARHWYPSHDFPNEKFTTEIICHVPREMVVLSNGRKLGETVDAATGMKAVHWKTDKPHVNYLVSLVAGYFKKIETRYNDLPMAFYTPTSQIHLAERSFEDTLDCMAYLEEEIGVKYPWEKYDQVCVQDFMWGGMENTSITTLTDRTLSAPEMETLASSQGLVAHELAHQWFGDLVTCKDWAHVWLNEGFATYYTLLYDRHKNGRESFLHGLWETGNRVLDRSVEQDHRPIVYREYDRDIEALSPSYMAYNKGAWVLHMLREQLGEDVFRTVVRTYLERHAYESVVTHDFIRILEEISGRSLDGFFDQWVFRRHHPYLKIDYTWEESNQMARFTVRQTQPVSAEIPLFRFPLTFRFHGEFGTKDLKVEVSHLREDFYLALPSAPDWVRVDPDLSVLAKIDFNPPRSHILHQVQAPDDVIGRILAVRRLAEFQDKESIERLQERLTDDPFHGVRQEAARALGRIQKESSREALISGLADVDARVRRAVVQELGKSFEDDVRQALKTQFINDQNPGVRAAVLSALGGFPFHTVQDEIESALNQDSFRDQVRSAAVRVVRDYAETDFLPGLVAHVQDVSGVYPADGLSATLDAAAVLARQSSDTAVLRELLQALAQHPRRNTQLAALRGLGELGDPRSISFLQKIARQPDDGVARAARDAVDKLANERPVRMDAQDLRRDLRELREEATELRRATEDLKKRLEAQTTR
jgi:aminopeptidase N